MRDRMRELARNARPVLVLAPPGFDAAAVAGTLHVLGGCGGALRAVSCGADDPAALESRLFGPLARRARSEIVETVTGDCELLQAQRGMLVLDGVQDLPVSVQTRLARILRDGEVRSATHAGVRAVRLAVRVVGTSELSLDDLAAEVRHGRFRPDLFRRLAARPLEIVPLRERRGDIGPIAIALMERAARDRGGPPRAFTQAALALLSALGWDGNLAALHSVVDALSRAEADGPVLVEDVLAELDPAAIAHVRSPRASLKEARRQFEREYIEAVLKHTGWRMGQAAHVLGIQRTNLYRKARQLGIGRAKAGE
jgi:DNA-binding NtrC family response regulator